MAASDYVPLPADAWRVRLRRFARAIVVGSAATAADLAVLVVAIRVVSLAPELARVPALLAGAAVQFFGNRRYTFRAERGSLARHARLFFVFEASAYVANLLLYRSLVHWLVAVPPELVSFLGTFVIFVAYSYPMRRLVIFRLLRKEVLDPPVALLAALACACTVVSCGVGPTATLARGSRARFSHPPVVRGSRVACLSPPYTPAADARAMAEGTAVRREDEGRRWVLSLAGDAVPSADEVAALVERLRRRGGLLQWVDYGLYCGAREQTACLHWEGNLCETNVERVAHTLMAAVAADAVLPRPRIELAISLAGRLGPRCAGDDLACEPVPYNLREAYDPLGDRHADVLGELSAGACEHDGECVQAGCGNHCVSWELGGAHEAATCEGYQFSRAVFCGCVAGECAWFTQ